MPNPVSPLLENLASCLCGALAAAEGPELCFCGVLPGDSVSFDYVDEECGSGMAWARLTDGAPSNSLGAGVNQSQVPGNCTLALAVELEIGVIRRAPVFGPDGESPDPADVLAATRLQLDDMHAMRKAVACCPGNNDFVLVGYTPIGPQGFILGGLWTLQAMIY